MGALQAIILGVVQGLTEFLPVSSSAHLNLFPWVFNWQDMGEGFDVALHIGTLLAVVLFFYKDWVKLIKGGYEQVKYKKKTTEGRLFWFIIFSTIPTGILCIVFDKLSEKFTEILAGVFGTTFISAEMLLISIALIVMGILLYVVDKKAKSTVDMKKITFKQSLWIAMSQAIAAAFPGVSRSGITMTVGRKMGLTIAAAALFKIKDFVFSVPFFLGILASFIAGMIVIKFLLKYLQKGSFKVFAIYRVALGIIVLLLFFIRM